jgi:hypothetical protein
MCFFIFRGFFMRVQVIKEAKSSVKPNSWQLCFQWCLYVYDNGTSQNGYRFIWRQPDGKLQPARGQARIPSINHALTLINEAKETGWGDYDGAIEGYSDNA